MRIHITGASGSGTTTLAAAVTQKLGYAHFDSDNYFWLPTEIPYTEKRDPKSRNTALFNDLEKTENWVLSGCKEAWGSPTTDHLYDLVVFLFVPPKARLERLRQRELKEFGEEALAPSGYFHENHKEFMEWASQYDIETTAVRSKIRHERWLATLGCEILKLEGDFTLEHNLKAVLKMVN